MAAAAKSRRSPRVALFIETSLAPGRGILRGISRYVREHEPWSLHHEPRYLEDGLPSWLKWVSPDGVIVRLHSQRLRDAIRRLGIPAVDVLGLCPHENIPLVHVDNTATAQLAASHLLERGFRHFGVCGFENVNWSEMRSAAFIDFLAQAGYRSDVYRMVARSRSRRAWEAEHDRLLQWVEQLPKPSGVLVCGDSLGPPVLEACRRAGIMLPDEIAVLGVSNDEMLCEMANPPLSSVVSNHRRVGYEAARLLDGMMRGEPPPEGPTYVPPVGVAVRQSTDVWAVDDPDTIAAVRFIRAHACEGISIDNVVEATLVSRSTLKRRFREFLGRSIHDEIVRVQIRQAQELLADTSLSISQVARKTGFAHPEYFTVVFKSTTGKTPRQYREDFLD